MLLEVCANSAQSAKNAQLGGAQRIELCQNLNEGGLTPSFATIDYCINRLQINTFVLIRPRAGHFCYNDEEFYLMCQEVLQCKKMGVSGVAVGFLHRDLSVDIKKTKQMVDLAAPMQVTFHRAFDLCVQPQKALEDIIACGCRRLLTSGGKSVAFEGIESLQNIVKQANKRIRIIAAAGINSNNVAEIITRTQIDEVHASCKHVIAQINENHTDIHFDFSNVSFAETDAREVAAIMNQLSRLGSIHRN